MKAQHRTWIVIVVIGLIVVVTMACGLSSASPTATAISAFAATLQASNGNITLTPGLSAVGSNGGLGGSNGNGSNGNGSNGNGNNGNGSSNGDSNSVEPTPTQLLTTNGGPYFVKQIETLGGEAISGFVCSLTQPFTVLSTTPHVTFNFNFVPQDAQQGKVAYAYSIPSAGESHDATGTYSIIHLDKGGTLQLSLVVSDHVVFKGFDGNIPNRYKFNLVPSGDTPCKPAP